MPNNTTHASDVFTIEDDKSGYRRYTMPVLINRTVRPVKPPTPPTEVDPTPEPIGVSCDGAENNFTMVAFARESLAGDEQAIGGIFLSSKTYVDGNQIPTSGLGDIFDVVPVMQLSELESITAPSGYVAVEAAHIYSTNPDADTRLTLDFSENNPNNDVIIHGYGTPTVQHKDGDPCILEVCIAAGNGYQEPLWDIKYLVNGQWVYELTGPVVEVSDSRNSQYRQLATELVVSDRVTEIGYQAFRYWDALVSVNLGNTVTSIVAYAFEFCTKLKNIDLSNSLEVIGDNSFGDCHSLEVLDFGENLQTIKPWALVNLYKLHTLVFRSNTPTTFGSNVFGNGGSNDTNPQYVYVPDNLVDEYYLVLQHILLNVRHYGGCRPLSQYTG